jgi:hypothetical protein
METEKRWPLLLSVALVLVLACGTAVYAAAPARPGKPDKRKPVHATDVELVKKISVRGRPPHAGGGKPSKAGAATGILGEPVSGERYAVVVGISDYPGYANDLQYCDDDALDMDEALRDVYGFDSDKVTLLVDEAATRQAILTAIDEIPLDAGEIVFFFSGHGASGRADDRDREKVDEGIVVWNSGQIDYIWDGELADAFAPFTTSRLVFVFDTCLAGGMADDLSGPNCVIAMAASETGYAYESDAWGGGHGEFTYYFVSEGMIGGEANVHDYDGDGNIGVPAQVTAEEAFDYAKSSCESDRPTIADEFSDDLLP